MNVSRPWLASVSDVWTSVWASSEVCPSERIGPSSRLCRSLLSRELDHSQAVEAVGRRVLGRCRGCRQVLSM